MPKSIIFKEVRLLIFIPLLLFFVLPAPIQVPDVAVLSPQITTVNLDTDLMAAVFSTSSESSESEEESESDTSSRLVIDDDDKLPHCPTWSFSQHTPEYTDYNHVYLLDGISRRLFKPPKV